MGIVFRARHKKLDRLVALKMLSGGGAASTVELRRFHEEARLTDHPNIVTVLDVGEEDGQPFFTMKLIDGVSLREKRDWIGDSLVRAEGSEGHARSAAALRVMSRKLFSPGVLFELEQHLRS